MEDFLNPSPNGLNNFNTTTSPFIDADFGLNSDVNFEENIFTKKTEIQNVVQKEEPTTPPPQNPIRKRINDFDAVILGQYPKIEAPEKINFRGKFEGILNPKLALQTIRNLKFEDLEDFFYTIFPTIYKSKVVKASLKRLVALNKIATDLITKKIPYGENQTHYSDLISSLTMASNIQSDLKKRIH